MTTTSARALLRRLGQFMDGFSACFSRRPQREAASQYLDGLFNDSERKSMQAMHGRLSDPGSYQALQHFITHSPWEASTRRYYNFNLSLHIYPVIGERPIGAISRADCRKLVTECRAKGLKLASLQGVQRTLSAVLSQAVEDGILSANPAFRMGKHLRRGDEAKSPIRPLTREDSETLLKNVLTHWPEHYAFFLMALRTGMRLGELLAVQWGDLDFANLCIEVQRNLVGGRLTTPKNHNRRRVDMSAHLAETLERRATAAKAEALKAGGSGRRGSSRIPRASPSTATTSVGGSSRRCSRRPSCTTLASTTFGTRSRLS